MGEPPRRLGGGSSSRLGSVRRLGGERKAFAAPRRLGPPAPEAALTLEEKLAAEVKKLDHGLNESMSQVSGRLDAEVSTDFWLCVVFQTAEQRVAFLEALRWDTRFDGDLWISGTELARLLQLKLPEGPEWKEGHVKEGFAAFAMKPG